MLHSDSWSIALPLYVAAFAGGYLIGAIPFGFVLTRLAGAGDIRSIGSGNIGATNVLRTGRKSLAVLTLLLDAFKGTAAVLAAAAFGGQELAVLAAVGAFLGHLFPVWLRFHGGKGVATYLGLLLAFEPLVALGFALVWLAVAFVTRYSSLAGLLASAVTPALLWGTGHWQQAQLFALLALLLWARHGQNLRRLLAGTEAKIGHGQTSATDLG